MRQGILLVPRHDCDDTPTKWCKPPRIAVCFYVRLQERLGKAANRFLYMGNGLNFTEIFKSSILRDRGTYVPSFGFIYYYFKDLDEQ